MKKRVPNRHTIREVESYWQTLYLVEIRFPGYTREVRHLYYELAEDYCPTPTKEDIAESILESFDPDLSVKNDEKLNTKLKELKLSDEKKAVQEWLAAINRYEQGLSETTIDNLFRKTFGFANIPSIDEPKTQTKANDYGIWLRFATWTPEEAVEFSLGENSSDEYHTRLDVLKGEIEDNPQYDPLLPQYFYKIAKELQWKLPIKQTDIKEYESESIYSISSQSKNYIYKTLIGMAMQKFEFKQGKFHEKKYVNSIIEGVEKAGFSITDQTIKKIFRNAWDEIQLLPSRKK